MREEDHMWQTAIYRFLVWAVACVVIFGLGISIWSGHWEGFRTLLLWLGIFSAALCLYAALIWTVAHLIVIAGRLFKKFSHRH